MKIKSLGNPVGDERLMRFDDLRHDTHNSATSVVLIEGINELRRGRAWTAGGTAAAIGGAATAAMLSKGATAKLSAAAGTAAATGGGIKYRKLSMQIGILHGRLENALGQLRDGRGDELMERLGRLHAFVYVKGRDIYGTNTLPEKGGYARIMVNPDLARRLGLLGRYQRIRERRTMWEESSGRRIRVGRKGGERRVSGERRVGSRGAGRPGAERRGGARRVNKERRVRR